MNKFTISWQSNRETGVLQENADSTLDLNVEPAWIQGITGCNVIVGVVDDGEYFRSNTYIIFVCLWKGAPLLQDFLGPLFET